MAAKKTSTWGGARPGAGRPRGTGAGPSPSARKNRVAVMLSDDDLRQLTAIARRRKRPLATIAYEMIARALRATR